MAQRLFTLPDGSHAFASIDSKWSALGVDIDPSEGLLTASQAMDITGMKHMELVEAPLFSRVEVPGEGFSASYKMPKNKGILIRDVEHGITKPVGVVGINRTTTQFEELAYPMDLMVEQSGGSIETFGLLEPGGSWFCIVRLPETTTIGGDEHIPYLWGTDGLWSNYVVQPRLVRFACTNQLPMLRALGRTNRGEGSYVMRHTSRAEVNLEAMRQAVGITYRIAEEYNDLSKIMLDQEFVDSEFKALTDDLFGVPEPDKVTGRISPAARTNYRKRVRALDELFAGNGATTETTWRNGRPTKWTAFQAITEYIDWQAPVKGVKGADKAVRRFERTMDGSVQRIKAQALEALS